MLNVLITFDYELFFGENFFPADEIIFKPTNDLMAVLDKHEVKATFFVDVLSVYMHQKQGLHDYCEKFGKQLKDMITRGHDVQLHIHSNWLKSEYVNGQWVFDKESYRIHMFGFDKEKDFSVDGIIKWGKAYLEELLRPIDPSYQCIAYRAGGYCIQPHQELFKALHENGIFIDSSVSLEQKSSGVNSYDFTGFHKKMGWWVDPDGALDEECTDAAQAIYEIPIGAAGNSLLRRLFRPETEKNFSSKNLRGTFIGMEGGKQPAPKTKKGRIGHILAYYRRKRMLTCDGVRYQVVARAVKKLTGKRPGGTKVASVAVIGHPKLIDELWLTNFDHMLTELKKNKKCDLVTMQTIGGLLSK